MSLEVFGETAVGSPVQRVRIAGEGLTVWVLTWGAVVQVRTQTVSPSPAMRTRWTGDPTTVSPKTSRLTKAPTLSPVSS